MIAAFDHNWNIHHNCLDEWCKFVNIPEADWQKKNEQQDCRLHDKMFEPELYNEACAIHDFFYQQKS